MAQITTLTGLNAFEIADSFAQASARILDFRVMNRRLLEPEQAEELEFLEDRLDQAVVLFRGYGIQLIGDRSRDAADDLKSAILDGKETLTVINNIKAAIAVGAAVVDLALAMLSKDAESVLNAIKTLKEVSETVRDIPED